MSDIVLKDKSGVKNTYNNINAINIPDGNGGFVKYSLGGTHLPEYDGTVIIEKAESGVLGLRRFKESVENITTVNAMDGDINTLMSEYGFTIEAQNTIDMISCVFYYAGASVGGASVQAVAYRYIEDGAYSYFFVSLEEFLEALPTFNVTSIPNATVDEWLLANTEGVSV